jgi:pimeloyl-ACP methyl ester carboxylesterase
MARRQRFSATIEGRTHTHRQEKPVMPFAAAENAEIYYETTGDGPPLLLVTGLGAGPDARKPFVDALAQRHKVVSYDQRGTGRSEGGPAGLAIEGHAEDIVAVLDAADIPTAAIFGHSTGTGAATVLAADHPDRVAGLALAAPWTHADAHLRALQEMRKAAARTMPPEHYARFNALLLYPPEYRRAHADRFAKMAADAARNPPHADSFCARLDAILAFDARPYYPRIACPALVLTTPDDQVMPCWFAEEAAELIPDARLVALDGGAHMMTETRMGEVVEAVTAFLKTRG